MKKSFAILILLFSTCIFSQEINNKNWILKINSTQLFDIFSFPTAQVSVERKINPFFSINAEFGYQLYDFHKTDTIFLKPKGFKSTLEGRLYIQKLWNSRKESKRSEFFIGMQFFYRQNQDTSLLNYKTESDGNTFEDNFGVKKEAKGINMTLGWQISVSKSFLLEPFVGFGMLNKKIQNNNIEYDKTRDEISGVDNFLQVFNLEESSGTIFNLCTGFRIGYQL